MRTFVLLDASNNVVNTIIADTQEIANQFVSGNITSALLIPEGSSFIDGEVVVNPVVEVVKPEVTVISKLNFTRRLTQSERIAIRNSTDDIVIDFRELLDMSQEIDLNDGDLIAGIDYLVSINLLTSERASLILTKV